MNKTPEPEQTWEYTWDWEIGQPVRFAHMKDGDPVFHVSGWTNLTSDGSLMLMIEELPGQFAPHVFVKVKD